MNWKDLGSAVSQLTSIISDFIIPLLFTLATAAFLWGIVRYVIAEGDEKKLAEAKTFILYGLIGLFVMVSVWGLVEIILNTFKLGDFGFPAGPKI